MNKLFKFLINFCMLCIAAETDNSYRSYQDTILCNPATAIQEPETQKDIQDIIKYAISKKLTVKAIGNRHSMTDVICTDGIPISMKNFKDIEISEDRKTVKLGSGVMLMDAINVLHAEKLSLGHVPAYGGITIGGAMGTGARGSSLKTTNSISEIVIGVEFIDGLGNYHNVQLNDVSIESSRESNIIKGFRVHLGLLGIILSATLQVEPDYKIEITNRRQFEFTLFSDKLIEEAEKHDVFQIFWYPNIPEIIISSGSRVNITSTLKDLLGYNDCSTNMIPGIAYLDAMVFSSYLEYAQNSRDRNQLTFVEYASQEFYFTGVGPLIKKPFFYEKKSILKLTQNPAIGYMGYMMTNICDGDGYLCPWDKYNDQFIIRPVETAIAIELKDLTAALTDIKTIFNDLTRENNAPIFPLLGIFIRFSGNFSWENYMAIENKNRTAYIEFINIQRQGNNTYTKSRMGMAAYQAMGQLLLTKYKGRPHWGKNGLIFHSRERLEKFSAEYHNATGEFKKLMRRYDPRGIFLNKFGKRFLNRSNEYDVDPRLEKCALWDQCYCSKDSDCEDSIQSCNKHPIKIEEKTEYLQICKDKNK